VLYKPYCVIIVTIKVSTWLCPRRSVLNSHMKTHNGGVKQIRSHPLPSKHLPIPSRKASRIARHEKLICLALSNLHASRAYVHLSYTAFSSFLTVRYFVTSLVQARAGACVSAKRNMPLSYRHTVITSIRDESKFRFDLPRTTLRLSSRLEETSRP